MAASTTTTDPWALVGPEVRRARKLRKLSIEKAAKMAKMSPVTWGKVEGGDSPTVNSSTLNSVAGVLGIDGDLLVRAWHSLDHLDRLIDELNAAAPGNPLPDPRSLSDDDLRALLDAAIDEVNRRWITRTDQLNALVLGKQSAPRRPDAVTRTAIKEKSIE